MALIPSPKHITDFPPIKVFYINETITVLQIELFKILFFFCYLLPMYCYCIKSFLENY